MGSTFKTFSTAMALDTQKVTFASQFDATSPITHGRFTISDFHPENRVLSVPEIFVHSSNIGTAKMALQLPAEQPLGAVQVDYAIADDSAVA